MWDTYLKKKKQKKYVLRRKKYKSSIYLPHDIQRVPEKWKLFNVVLLALRGEEKREKSNNPQGWALTSYKLK